MNIFDIYIAFVTWSEGGKARPVLILEQYEMVIFVFIITTQYDGKSEAVRIRSYKRNFIRNCKFIDTL